MNKKLKDIIIGLCIAAISALIIICSVEYDKNFGEILIGFIVFLFPFIFITSFHSKLGSFILFFSIVMIVYIVSSLYLNDFWIGVVLAGIIGGAVFYFRVHQYRPYNPEEYRNSKRTNNL